MTSSDPGHPDLDARAVLDALLRAVVATDPTGRILLWNRAAERLYGWTEEEVLGRSVLDVLPTAAHAKKDAEDLEAIAAGAQMSGDRLVLARDGTSIRVHTATAPVVDEEGNTVGIVGSAEDVAALRAVEQRSSDMSEQLRVALDAGGLGTWRWNMSAGQIRWDERLESLFGLDVGGFDGSYDTYVSLLHPADRASVQAKVAEALRTKSSYRVEHRVVWPDASVHWLAGAGDVTLDAEGEVTGTVGCVMDVTDRIEQELELERLAEIAVTAADHERLQRERLEFLAQINEALNTSSSVREVMENVTSSAVPRLGAWCTIHVVQANGRGAPDVEVAHVDPNMVAYARTLHERLPYDPDAQSGVPAVIRTGITEFVPEINDMLLDSMDIADEARALVSRLDLASAITVAMKKRGRVVGALQFIRTTESRRFTSDDVSLAETLAGRVASSIENLRLHSEQQMIAHTLQRSLLPATVPDVAGIDIAVRYWPNGEANEVGGDFYDVFEVDDGCVAVVLGDVCGTGPAAAALTGLARHTVRDSAWHGDDHEAVLESLNRAVRRSGNNTFLTCVYATVHAIGGEFAMTVSCGGHPLPVHVTGSAANTLGTPGTLLGAFDDIVVRPTQVRLQPGDTVVFHTDGITDVPPPHGLSSAEWTELVADAARHGGSAEHIADRIRTSIETVLPFAGRHDDIALLVLTVEEQPAD